MNTHAQPEKCFVCGHSQFALNEILWWDLIDEWEINPIEVEYINMQQGLECKSCKSNLRSITLAKAILVALSSNKTLRGFVRTLKAKRIRILEVNEAGTLHSFLKDFTKYTFAEYPEVDLHAPPYANESFDLLLHSDTLEHVKNPSLTLKEIFRVLKKGGKTIFTTPIIVDRLTRSREKLPKSFHGAPGEKDLGMLVTQEYGSDFWKFIAEAGFSDIRIITELYPAGIAFIATK